MAEKTDKKADDGYKKADTSSVLKLEKEGDFIEGVLMNYEESKMYKDSYALAIRKEDGKVETIFTNEIPVQAIKAHDLLGKQVKIIFKGMTKTKDGKFEYKEYDVLFKD